VATAVMRVQGSIEVSTHQEPMCRMQVSLLFDVSAQGQCGWLLRRARWGIYGDKVAGCGIDYSDHHVSEVAL